MQKLTQDLEALNLSTMEEISKEYDRLQLIVQDYEETCGDQKNLTFDEAIKKLQAIQKGIIEHGVFSPNEDYKEIQTQNLKYLLLPYYLGDVFGRIPENRKKSLEFSKLYLNEFLKLLDHYGVLSEQLRKTWKNYEENTKYEPTRDERIAQYKEQKEIENKIKNFEKIKEEVDQREVIRTYCNLCIYKALDQLKSIKQEMEILEYQQQIQNDEEAKEIYEAQLKKPIPQLKSYTIPKSQNQDLPYMISQAQKEQMCHSCHGKSLEEIKQVKKQEVWRPDISQPSVRLEELGDMYMRDMAKMEEQKKQHQLQEELEKGDNYDSDKEEEVEKVRLENTYWDNWKDENEKGAGNKGGGY
ncbi:hypothetical protein PPERSA_12099 [Pseudocohnilembus persalinus]|uniref:TAP42-like protein n=1 Tax=Pseudocohnilembus persalinus TaxID=266149 RepID=A0A0V0R910_PSEPJ|nr:hypothetical protein PPERSA_12099 [Pseudocohnilembus persalinus]|eukprot:KRX10975.1 hypothetical protein PPERSA_12099 [Pseudocohnilembus persalinus]